jgi:hypothetical protein
MNDEAAREGRSADVTPPTQSLQPATVGPIWRAMMLAPTLEVCEALLRGERVPIGRLDRDWVKRFGVKS